MKRVVSASIITLLIIVAIAATFYYLKNLRGKGGDPLNAIPSDVAFVLAFQPDADNLGGLLDMNAWPLLKKSPAFSKLEYQLQVFDSVLKKSTELSIFLGGSSMFVSGHVTGAGTFDFLFLKSLDNGQTEKSTDVVASALFGEQLEWTRRNYDGNSIRETTLESGKTITYVVAKGIFIASATPFLVEDALRQLKLGKPVISGTRLTEAVYEGNDFKLCLNFRNFPMFSGVFIELGAFDGMSSLKNYGNWTVMKATPNKHKLQFSGEMFNVDTNHLVNCFRGQQPVSKQLLKILPRKTAFVNYYGASDIKTFHQKLVNSFIPNENRQKNLKLLQSFSSKYKINIAQQMFEWMGEEYALVITEPSGSTYDNNSFAVIKARDIKKAKKSLASMSNNINKKNNKPTKEESYNGYNIGNISLTGVLPAILGESFNKVNKMYYTMVEDYIVVGNQASAIRSFIDDFRSGLLLYKTDYFQDLNNQYADKCNHFIFVHPEFAVPIFKSMANDEWKKNADNYKDLISGISSIAYQYSNLDGTNSVQASISFLKKENAEGSDQMFAIETDSSVSMKTLLTTDPQTKTRQLVFQDDANNLYMCDNSGNIMWKQPVDGKIMGEIFEIDLFRNNSRQFIFNTEQYIYLFDTKGAPVGNYPIRLPAHSTNSLSVFDFDKNKDFKIYIACSNNRIYGYLSSGKPLPGWNFQLPLGLVTDPVRSVTFNGRVMLFINDRDGRVFITNRYGEQAMNIDSKITPSINTGIFNTASGSILFSDEGGSIVEILSDGKVQIIPMEIAESDHGFAYADVDDDGESDYIYINGNEITAYDKQMVLIYRKEFEASLTGKIKLVRLNNKEQVMVVSSPQSNQTWMVKMDGNIYPGFPLKGSSPVVVDELNLDGNKNLIVGGSDHRVYVYTIH